MIKEGEYYKVLNNKLEIVCAGKVINTKTVRPAYNKQGLSKNLPFFGISFDNKYYFNINNSLFKYEKSIPIETFILLDKIDEKNIALWKDVSKNPNCAIYREYDITELDEEVVEIVTTLNLFDNIETVGSCSGHGKESPWIDIKFTNLKMLNLFLNVLTKKDLNECFYLWSNKNIENKIDDYVILQLKAYRVGKEAYNDINKLNAVLKTLYTIVG